jgi:hypothetical protein
MPDRSLIVGLAFTAAASSACAPFLAPYGHRYPGSFHGPLTPAPVVVDPEAMARGRWDRVMRLPPGSTVDVLTMDGGRLGTIIHADGYSIRMVIDGIDEQIVRADVLRVDLLDLPGSEVRAVGRRTLRGAVVGLGAAALLAGVIGGEAWPPPGVLLRGGAAVGGVAGGKAALIERGPRLIYLAEGKGDSHLFYSGRNVPPSTLPAFTR